jgi:hypothetical protein
MELKRTLLLVAVPAVLVLGGASVIAATPKPAPPATHASQPVEAPDATTEAPDAADAPEATGAVDTGHADNPADANVDHQFDGQE